MFDVADCLLCRDSPHYKWEKVERKSILWKICDILTFQNNLKIHKNMPQQKRGFSKHFCEAVLSDTALLEAKCKFLVTEWDKVHLLNYYIGI